LLGELPKLLKVFLILGSDLAKLLNILVVNGVECSLNSILTGTGLESGPYFTGTAMDLVPEDDRVVKGAIRVALIDLLRLEEIWLIRL
jgi:hypothetical protein